MDSSCYFPIIALVILIVIFLIFNSKQSNKNRENPPTITSSTPNNQPRNIQPPRPIVFPTNTSKNFISSTSARNRSKIVFKDIDNQRIRIANNNISDLHDALTGAPLNEALGLFQCNNCKIYYQTESYKVLCEINSSACVFCASKDIKSVTTTSATKTGFDFTPQVVTLDNYREFVGKVVTFEGFVYNVFESRRGNDFAVMFEDKTWVSGFKLVFFKGDITNIDKRKFVNSLKGKSILVRGLIKKDERFGYEIVVSEQEMILRIR